MNTVTVTIRAKLNGKYPCLPGPAVELAPIRVNAVSPGGVRTNLWQNRSAPGGNVYTKPWATVSLLAESAKLMLKKFATGQTVVVDGGTSWFSTIFITIPDATMRAE